jgi:hypothetical protein
MLKMVEINSVLTEYDREKACMRTATERSWRVPGTIIEVDEENSNNTGT